MANEAYSKAQKMGMKSYKTALAEGKSPYLPVLDEILSLAEIEYEIPIGVCDIPLEQVVGTSTLGRTRAFADNFMPLLKEGTEFSNKWSHLADAQVEEGIRNPIKAYEYMNKYYVVEGNKRVSVLKYYNAPTIQADITRKVPKRSEELENRIYYEYMEFYELTRINYVLFSKSGSYNELLMLVNNSTTGTWSEDLCRLFASFYAEFDKVFTEKGGRELKQITAGDAMLFFLSIYPFEEAKDYIHQEMKNAVEKIWPEILVLGTEDSVRLSLDPMAERTTVNTAVNSVLNMFKGSRRKRVAFVYPKTPASSNWIYGHELGRLHLDEVFGEAVETKAFLTEDYPGTPEQLMEQLCTEGYDVIFSVSPSMLQDCLKAAIDYPHSIIMNCSLNSSYPQVRTYYTRMYEAKFLTGMIAGALTANNKVGYVADYLTYGVPASINAFALGARMVNPHAQVYLTWSSLKDCNIEEYYRGLEISYISSQDMITPNNDNRQFGLYEVTGYGIRNLALSIYDWGAFYERLIGRILRGSWKTGEEDTMKAINYWWGLSAGVIDVICSGDLPAGTVQLAELMKRTISSEDFHPFTGPITDQNGVLRCTAGQTLSHEEIMLMDWLADNVTGFIPDIEELKQSAVPGSTKEEA